MSIAGQADMMGTLSDDQRLPQFRFRCISGQIKGMTQAGIGGGDIHVLAAIDEVHLQRHAAIDL